MKKLRACPRLEQLEDRVVPSLTLQFVSGSAYLSGAPVGEVDIIHPTGMPINTFKVTDNGSTVGQGSILNNLYVTLTNERADVKLDLNGGVIPGSVTLGLGSGYVGRGAPGTYSINLYDDSSPTPTGRIGGSVSILQGNGQESYNIGGVGEPATGITDAPLTISGNLNITAVTSNNGGQGDALLIDDGTSIIGTATLTQVDDIAIGSATSGAALVTIGGSLSINDYGTLHTLTVVDNGYVGGTVTVTGTENDDAFTLESTGTLNSGVVVGNLSVNLEDGQSFGDQILLGANTDVQGSATLSAGGNTNLTTGDQFKIFGEVDQNLNVYMGSGMNSVYFMPANILAAQPFVGGNMTITGGNGTNNIGVSATGEFQGMVQHNLSITLGSGANGSATDPMVIATQLGGTLTWRSGNGQDFLQLGDFALSGTSYNYVVNIVFGNLDDTLNIDIGTFGLLSGSANGGGRVVANTFDLISGNEAPTFQETDFP